MKLVKLEQAQEFSNSDSCKGLEYPLNDIDINFSTAIISGRYPDKGYCVNEECKELIYVIEGKQVYVPDFPIGVGYQNYDNWSKLLKNYLDLGLINENTTIIGHSIAPVFISKFLTENKVKVKKLIFVCGFNNYLGINEEYDAVNKSMYFDNLENVKQYANEIICFYSNNDPYVKYEVEKDFADKIATEQILIPNAGHINSESGYDTFEDIVNYL